MTLRIALIPAAGESRRFGGERPKQYANLAGKTLLAHALDRLSGALSFDAMFVALSPDDVWYRALIGGHDNVIALYCGGSTRLETVANALAIIGTRCSTDDWILLHDVAHPCVPPDALKRLVDALENDSVGGLLAIPVADTLKQENPTMPSRVLRTIDRSRLWQPQAPRMFRYSVLRDALARTEGSAVNDETEAVEWLARTGACASPTLVPGSALNIEVIVPSDLDLAEAIVAGQT